MFANLSLLVIGFAISLAVGVGVWRLTIGPTTLDRMLAFDFVVISVSGLVLVLSAAAGSTDFVEFVFILSALGFLTTVAYFYYLMQLHSDDANFDPEESP